MATGRLVLSRFAKARGLRLPMALGSAVIPLRFAMGLRSRPELGLALVRPRRR